MQRPLRTLLSQSPVITTAAAVVAIVGLCFILGIQATPLLQCLMIAGLVGVSWSLLHKRPHIPSNLALLEQPFALACDEELFTRYRLLIDSLLKISQSRDPIFRVLSLESLDETVRRVDALADGLLMFEGTETWRIVYERLLRSAGLYRYRSVAWIQSAAYWQDEPGRKSMAVNIELQSTGQVSIERIAIIADHLWPPHDVWPVESLRQWIHEQYACGIQISFVRES
ncbi:MAG TPA: hypothetical protein PK992_14805, partial [Planctomycetaceae bacterium]|nr:hypothetical protein [Planctomycetaceae bacterium]